MPTSDEQVAQKRKQVEKLREQLAAATAKRVEREQNAVNDIVAEQLDREAASLQAQLDAIKGSKVSPPDLDAATADVELVNKEG